jgi:hypothetical protein
MELSFKDENQEFQKRLLVIHFSIYSSWTLPFWSKV